MLLLLKSYYFVQYFEKLRFARPEDIKFFPQKSKLTAGIGPHLKSILLLLPGDLVV